MCGRKNEKRQNRKGIRYGKRNPDAGWPFSLHGVQLPGSFQDRLCLCNWTEGKHPGRVDKRLQASLNAVYEETLSDVVREAVRQLDEYFLRKRQTFDVPLLFAGTDFQKAVWRQLLEIPYGRTLSYGGMAAVSKLSVFYWNWNGGRAENRRFSCGTDTVFSLSRQGRMKRAAGGFGTLKRRSLSVLSLWSLKNTNAARSAHIVVDESV